MIRIESALGQDSVLCQKMRVNLNCITSESELRLQNFENPELEF